MKGESGRDGLDGTDGVQGPPGNVLIIPTNTGSKGPDNRYSHYHNFLFALIVLNTLNSLIKVPWVIKVPQPQNSYFKQ